VRQRPLVVLAAVALAVFVFRNPLELALLHHAEAPPPETAREPIQEPDRKAPFEFVSSGRRYRLIPRFRWDEAARVMSEEPYRFDAAAGLIPMDWALAWGPVLLPPYAGKLHFSQTGRFFLWGTSDGSLDRGTLVTHMANTHIIPATSRLRRAAGCVRKGDDVRLEGWLVDVEGIDDPSFRWRTSVSREDEGPGGCETVYLTRLTVGTRVYE
jgi:hypothetical protein